MSWQSGHEIITRLESECKLDIHRDEDVCRQTYFINQVDVYCSYSKEKESYDCCCSGDNCNSPEGNLEWTKVSKSLGSGGGVLSSQSKASIFVRQPIIG